ncbi:MAG: ribosome silencing factor [Bacteroidia bacterium]
MTESPNLKSATLLLDVVIHAMQEKQAKEISSLDLRKLPTSPADFFVICHADNDRQVEAIARSVDEETRAKLGERPWHLEGMDNKCWVLMDYVDIVVHIFQKEQRKFYNIEGLWADAETTTHED